MFEFGPRSVILKFHSDMHCIVSVNCVIFSARYSIRISMNFRVFFRCNQLHNARQIFGFGEAVSKKKVYQRKELVG